MRSRVEEAKAELLNFLLETDGVVRASAVARDERLGAHDAAFLEDDLTQTVELILNIVSRALMIEFGGRYIQSAISTHRRRTTR